MMVFPERVDDNRLQICILLTRYELFVSVCEDLTKCLVIRRLELSFKFRREFVVLYLLVRCSDVFVVRNPGPLCVDIECCSFPPLGNTAELFTAGGYAKSIRMICKGVVLARTFGEYLAEFPGLFSGVVGALRVSRSR